MKYRLPLIPAHIPGDTLASRARALATEALREGLPPIECVGEKEETLHLPDSLSTQIKRLAVKLEQTEAEVFSGLVAAALRHRGEKSAAMPVDEERERLQAKLRSETFAALQEHRIALAEGGTGLGKSRVIAQLARAWMREHDHDCVLVVAPTISVLTHLVAEWQVVSRDEGLDIPISVVIGRGQFISTDRLRELLTQTSEGERLPAEDWKAAAKWLDAGCPALSEASQRLAAITKLTISGLADDLRSVAPSFPIADCLLAEEEDDESTQQVYYALRDAAGSARLVFTSHAALCLDVLCRLRERERLLPDFALLLADEAHMLEAAMANAVGGDVSLLRLRTALRTLAANGVRGSAKRVAAMCECCDALTAVLSRAKSDGDLVVRAGGEADEMWKAALPLIERLTADFTKLLNKKDSEKDPLWRQLRAWAAHLRKAGAGKSSVRVSFSPVQRRPTIVVGPTSLRSYFERLWKDTTAAALLSATLYVDTQQGWSAAYTRMQLSIPTERVSYLTPAHPAWLYSGPTLLLPHRDAAKALTYPSHEDGDAEVPSVREALAQWTQAIVAALHKGAHDAVGGTLVLCTSYLDVERLAQTWKDRDTSISARLLTAQRTLGMTGTREHFISAARAGKRPIWLATGPAWTGLDLRDSSVPDAEAERDILLTDLFLVRLPFSLNRSAVHLQRVEFMGFDSEMHETGMRLRQGLGRLIRRGGVKHRRLWFLDGRLYGPRARYYDRIVRILHRYTRRETFALA